MDQLMEGAGEHLPPLLSLQGMQKQSLLLDPAGRVAVIPGDEPVTIVAPRFAQVVKLLESASGHLMLPLDEKFVVAKEAGRQLIFHTGSTIYKQEAEPDDLVEEEVSPAPSARILVSAEQAARAEDPSTACSLLEPSSEGTES